MDPTSVTPAGGLPIDEILPRVAQGLSQHASVVVIAPPGSGKTTRVPRYLLESGRADEKQILVVEPRRLAARLAARYVAQQMGEEVGHRVGYQIRFETAAGPNTRLRFVTDGLLARRLARDPSLQGVKIVVLDEFHERRLASDLCLTLLLRLQRTERPDLALVVMSATLDATRVCAHLGDARVLQAQGSLHDVAITYDKKPDSRPLAPRVAAAIHRLCESGAQGDVLVFLPGVAEIRAAQRACAALADRYGLLLLPLHGGLRAQEQERAIQAAPQAKIIFSTNVAETSVTIDGVTTVLDSGTAKRAGHDPWTGLSTLRTRPISRASAAQRAGRAGRTQSGACLRLYTQHEHDSRPAFELPEISRLDLSETVLHLYGAGIREPLDLPWLDPPPSAAVEAAQRLLRRLGALTKQDRLTPLGQRMRRLPTHPRLACIVAHADMQGHLRDGCLIAALVSEWDPRRQDQVATSRSDSDVLALRDVFQAAEKATQRSRGFARGLGFDLRSVARSRDQLLRAWGPLTRSARHNAQGVAPVGSGEPPLPTQPQSVAASSPRSPVATRLDAALLRAILAGFPDRVARLVKPSPGTGAPTLLLASGGRAQLAERSVGRHGDLVVAVEARAGDPRGGRRAGQPRNVIQVVAASAIEEDWLLDLFPDELSENRETRWNPQAERAETWSRILYDKLVLDEVRSRHVAPEQAAERLCEAALAKGVATFAPTGAIDALLARVDFVRNAAPELAFPALSAADAEATLAELCVGRCSFSELRQAGLLGALRQRLGPTGASRLDELAPESLRLPGGRRVAVHYEPGKPPWIASWIQDFFGMLEVPRLAGGRLPTTVHLLAPNRRAVQVTADLAAFWATHYGQLKNALARRYPKHDWPDDPRTAPPPRQTGHRARRKERKS